MYGPGQIGEVGHGWVAWFIREALAGSAKIKISGNGKQVRDLLHIDDAAAAYLAAAEHADACAGRAFNVGGGRSNSLSILELVALLRELRGWQPRIECGPWRLSDQRSFVSGNAAFTGATGWAPRISARDGIGALL
jgi:CDP-paratose 2-epimerase